MTNRKNQSKIKFGIVGCGRISKNHINAINENSSNAELIAVCDNNSKALETTKELTNVKSFLDLKEMIRLARPDVISVTTPSGLHSEQSIQIAQSGIHVISEKPMATNLKDAKKMINVCENSGVKLFIVKQNRYNPTIKFLKNAIVNGRFGKIYMVNINVFWSRPQTYYDQASWRGTWKYDGGAFLNQASHYMDLAIWLFGKVKRLHAFTGTLARNIEAEDTGVVNVLWENGIIGSINTTMLTYPKNLEGSITVLGEKGTVKIGGIALNKILKWEFENSVDYDTNIKDNNYDINSVYGSGHPVFYKEVIKALRNEDSKVPSGEEGIKSLKFILDVYKSSHENIIINH